MSKTIDKAIQNKMTPSAVLEDLMEGNNRFVNQNLISRDYKKQRATTVGGQFPKAIILSCIDSRVPVEIVFDQGVGDVFVARIAGNFENSDILGSMEYACKVAGSKLVFVLGHESCGAIKAACDSVDLGLITPLLSRILPAVDKSHKKIGEKRSSTNTDLVDEVIKTNVELTIKRIRQKSIILKEMEEKGDIRISGGIYHLLDGLVTLI